MNEIRRGDVFVVDLEPVSGSEQGGTRPCVVLQNTVGNKYSPTVILAPITSRLKKRDMPTRVMLPQGNGFSSNSMILLEHIRTVDKRRLKKHIKSLEPELMDKVDAALAISIGLSKPKYEEMELCLCPACVKQFINTDLFIVKKSEDAQGDKDICYYCNAHDGFDYRIINKKRRYVSSV